MRTGNSKKVVGVIYMKDGRFYEVGQKLGGTTFENPAIRHIRWQFKSDKWMMTSEEGELLEIVNPDEVVSVRFIHGDKSAT